MDDVLADEALLAHLGDEVYPAAEEDDHVIYVGDVADVLRFLESRADKSLLAVHVELLALHRHLGRLDVVEAADRRPSRVLLPEVLVQRLIPADRLAADIAEPSLGVCHLVHEPGDGGVALLLIKLQDPRHLELQEVLQILIRHGTEEGLQRILQSAPYMRHHLGDALRLLEVLILVDPPGDEELLEGLQQVLLLQLAQPDPQLGTDVAHRPLAPVGEYLTHGEELRVIVSHHAAIGRDRDLAAGKGVERIDRLVGRDAARQLDLDIGLRCGLVIDLLDLDLPGLVRLQDRVDEAAGRAGVGQLRDGEGVRVDLLDPCPHLYLTSTLSVAVLGDIDQSAGGEVRIELVRLTAEVADAGLQQLAHIVRENLAGESDCDALSALSEEERKLHRQIDRLLIGSVVRGDVVGDLRGEEDPLGEWRKACFDVARRRSTVAGEEVTPVPLTLDQELSLPQLHKRIADARISVRVELHRLADDIRHLDQPILHLRHRVEDPSLHRL